MASLASRPPRRPLRRLVRRSPVLPTAAMASSAPAHPPECDRTGYLRYRPVGGPESSAAADHVIVQQPGAIGGAVNSDSVAANTVAAAHVSGRNIEFWALARRSACLDETTGGMERVIRTSTRAVPPPPTAQVVTLPGYSHVDTIGAASVRNDGKTDLSAQTLADFVGSLR
ncbi:hypothetical protein LTV02_08730 [Nocardia yamanashiensis]|uniref:hypothetical protein n=1 Tax=Nocardia yamanashiensis TaxID=209247 RepID=UPI001E62697D|nr:hypothetical protein [Nocardia yamanashiensis]UGT43452.1 hypothetical protein LTV02_08730 [Nocardia yamanashiensis]